MGYLSWILGAIVALLFGFLAPLGDYREELRSKLLGLRGFGRALFGKRQTSLFAGFFIAIFYIVRFLLEVPLWVLYWAWRSYLLVTGIAAAVGIWSLMVGAVLVSEPVTGGIHLGPWMHPAAWFYLVVVSLLFFAPAIWQLQAAKDWWTPGARQEGTQLKQK